MKPALLLLAAAALGAAAPRPPGTRAPEFRGCLEHEGPLAPAATRGLATRRHLVKVTGPAGDYRCALELEGWSLKDVLSRLGPGKKAPDGFDRPLDTYVLVTGRDGRRALFSWSEVFMAGDGGPLLASRARLVLPHHHDKLPGQRVDPTVLQDVRGRNRADLGSCEACHDGGSLLRLALPKGLLLAAPSDPYGGRFVEDVARVEIRQAGIPGKDERATHGKAFVDAPDLVGPDGARIPLDEARFKAGAAAQATDAAFGEGMGYHGVRHWTGVDLGSLLRPLLPRDADPRNCFVLITAADGYRSLFSGSEVFQAPEGRSTLLADRINGEPLQGGSGRYHAVPRADFYIDRDVRMVKEIRLVAPAP